MTAPRVSVVLSVYNGADFVADAIRSILDQTFRDLELVVIDDGSTDDTPRVLASFDDPRLVVTARENRGLTPSLNEGIERARATYVARQDADDVSLPTRIERQVAFLDGHPRVVLVGTNYVVFDERGELARSDLFTHPDDLKVAQGLSNQFGHGSVMMRRDAVLAAGGYDSTVGHVEDYDLFARLAHDGEIANLAEPLYRWRRNTGGVSFSNQSVQLDQMLAIRDREFERIVSHRNEYRVFSSLHPFSTRRSPVAYLERKSGVLRDLAWLHNERGRRAQALAFQLAATAFAPWRRRNLRYVWRLARRPGPRAWEYEWV
jgi:glycosyltransferase involved in cell wall biosynthesis